MALAHVQTVNNSVSAASVSVTLTTTATNAVLVTLETGAVGLASLVGLAQSAGDTLTLDAGFDNSGTYQARYSNLNVAGGSTTYTFTWTGSTTVTLYVTEVSGMAAASAFDVSASSAFAVTPTPTSGTTATLAQAAEFALATFNLDGSGSTAFTSVSNGFTVPTNGNLMGAGVAGTRALVCYKITAATTGVETTLTGDNMAVTGFITTHKEASAAPTFTVIGRTVLDYD